MSIAARDWSADDDMHASVLKTAVKTVYIRGK